MRIERTNSENDDFRALVGLLDAGLKVIDGDEAPFFAQYNKIDTINHVVMAYDGDEPIGCGAFKPYGPAVTEIKRMFVLETERGKGIAATILSELEHWAIAEGFETAILETGNKMTAAIRLYEKSGYERTPNYGQYIGVDSSVCMKKDLKR
jgi:putative acetyltransferase